MDGATRGRTSPEPSGLTCIDVDTRMGRDFLRAYHADGLSYYGQDDTTRRFLTFKGKMYQFLLTTSRTFIEAELTGEILAKN